MISRAVNRCTFNSLRKTTAKVILKRILNQIGQTHVLMSATTSPSDYAALASSQVDHKEFLSSIPAHCLSKECVLFSLECSLCRKWARRVKKEGNSHFSSVCLASWSLLTCRQCRSQVGNCKKHKSNGFFVCHPYRYT